VEKRKRNRHEWTQHEEGNVLADVAASPAPDQLKKQYPTSTNITITAAEMIFQICPPDVWNVYKSPMTPVPWIFVTQSRQARNHTQYLHTRTENSARIHRNRDWTKFNMQLTSMLWKNDNATTLDKQRSLKIIYDLYWHGGNRSKDQQLDEVAKFQQGQEVAKCPLCNAPESQEHIVLQCTNPIMKHARDNSRLTITNLTHTAPYLHRRINAPSLLLAFAYIQGEAGTPTGGICSAVVGRISPVLCAGGVLFSCKINDPIFASFDTHRPVSAQANQCT
jgi:hypothetical protein